MIRLRNSILLLLILVPGLVFPQAFKYKCQIKTPDSTGFYSIKITPELSSHLKTELSDIRIIDSKGRWVPHIVRTDGKERQPHEETVDLRILSIQNLATQSIVIVSNDSKTLLNNFLLRLKNAATERMVSLSGSNDNNKWFIISDSNMLGQPLASVKDENVQQILVPPTQYSFFKLTIRNSGKDPLNILGVTSQVDIAGHRIYPVENPMPLIHQTDSSRWSLIHVSNTQPFQMNELSFEVKRPALYDRMARVYLEKKDGILRTWDSYPLAEIRISSRSNLSQTLPLVRAKDFYILVSNEDNPPLEISSVRTFQPVRDLVAYLENGNSYELLFEDPNAIAPNYDLNEFAGKIPAQPATLAIGNPIANTVGSLSTAEPSRKWWIWVAIAAVIFALAYLTWQLTKDMNRKNEVS